MAIQKVSVSTKAYSVPQLKNKELPLSDINEFTYPANFVSEENLIELDYLYEVSPVDQPLNIPELSIEIPLKSEIKFRYPTLGVNFIDRDVGVDENGIESDPIIKNSEFKSKEVIKRIEKFPNSSNKKEATWDWSAAHAKAVWDNSVEQLKDGMSAIGDKAAQMGKDVINSLFGFHPLPKDAKIEDRLPYYVGNMHSLAYAPFMVNTTEKPEVNTGENKVGGVNWKNFFKDLIKNDNSKYPIYPPWIPELKSISYQPYLLYSGPNKEISISYVKNQDSYLRARSITRNNASGLHTIYTSSNTSSYVSMSELSKAFYPANLFEEFTVGTSYGLFYDVGSNNLKTVHDYNKKIALKYNSISTIIDSHYTKLAYFPVSFNSNTNEPIFPISKLEWKDFYNLSNTKDSLEYNPLIIQFRDRLQTNDEAKKIKWNYEPYKTAELVYEALKEFLKKNGFAQKFDRIEINNDDVTIRPTSLSRSTNAKNFSPYAMIERIGPDFMQHKFDAYFVWDIFNGDALKDWDEILANNKNGDGQYSWLSDYERYVLSKKGFAVRVGQINIPKISNEDFSIPFLETEVKKIKSTKAMNNQSSFTLRLDQNLIWLDMINGMAGHINTIDEHLFASSKKHPYLKPIDREPKITENSGDPRRWRSVLKLISKSWPPGSVHGRYNIKDSELCLVVKMSHLSNWINVNKQQKVLPYFVFENVRILGTSDRIQYNKESNIQSITINFIFKRCYEITQGFTNLDQFGNNKWVNTTNKKNGEELQFVEINPRKVPTFSSTDTGPIKTGLPKINTYEDTQFDWLNGSDYDINTVPTLTGGAA